MGRPTSGRLPRALRINWLAAAPLRAHQMLLLLYRLLLPFQLSIVTCMDSRLLLDKMLPGLDIGDAEIIRNAGGRVTPDVVRSLFVAQVGIKLPFKQLRFSDKPVQLFCGHCPSDGHTPSCTAAAAAIIVASMCSSCYCSD